jgi:hypothetical protein
MKTITIICGFILLFTLQVLAQDPYCFCGPTNNITQLKKEWKDAGLRVAQQTVTTNGNKPYYAKSLARLDELFNIGINRDCPSDLNSARSKWQALTTYTVGIYNRGYSASTWKQEEDYIKNESYKLADIIFVKCPSIDPMDYVTMDKKDPDAGCSQGRALFTNSHPSKKIDVYYRSRKDGTNVLGPVTQFLPPLPPNKSTTGPCGNNGYTLFVVKAIFL